MVKGLDRFKEHFAPFIGSYVLIGGTACMLAMEEAGLHFRMTKDLDIVLSVEALDEKFVQAFWEFIKKGKYQHRQKSTGKRLFYRFYAPEDASYPEMLELFSRKPDAIKLAGNSHLTPIPIDEEVSSLSAILLDEDYYRFIHEGKQETAGLPVVSPTHLIPLKVRAWLDLSSRVEGGAEVDEKDIRKHKNDVIRLYQLLSASARILLPQSVKQDMEAFLVRIGKSAPIDFKALGLKYTNLDEVVATLSQIYGLSVPEV
ncbi:MAG: nucleotidyl transferase AbiEii/AbiGii toxin family protein [Simkania sp.]|nr:nucleotidyl transferase AbiEii/AbiGii toxin family protein [Simkania sp.]